MDGESDHFPAQRPLEKHARIEADLFCDHCGYNLHTQPVVRDERLGILIVRCTECGRFQPAGVASNAGRVWLSRLGAIAVAAWAVFVLAVVAWGTIGLGGLQVVTVELFSAGRYYYAFEDGEAPVHRSWDPQSRQTIWIDYRSDRPVPAGAEPVYRRSLQPAADVFEYILPAVLVGAVMLLAPMLLGGILAVLMWHVRRPRLVMFLVLPLLAAVVITSIFHAEESDRGGNTPLVVKLVAVTVAVQVLMMLAGMFAGRPVARFFATLFIPPRPRQAIAFLWTVDGKPAPSARPPL